ncbi:MAG: phosphoribosylpyrophosphate synthetase [Bacteroidota bacterium]
MKSYQMAIDNRVNKDWAIIEALNKLIGKEYKLKFRREATCIYCFQLHEWIMPEDFEVDESYYFEDILNPDADRMLYAISLSQGGKGFLIDACNVYIDNISPEMEQRLNKMIKHEDDFVNTRSKKEPGRIN